MNIYPWDSNQAFHNIHSSIPASLAESWTSQLGRIVNIATLLQKIVKYCNLTHWSSSSILWSLKCLTYRWESYPKILCALGLLHSYEGTKQALNAPICRRIIMVWLLLYLCIQYQSNTFSEVTATIWYLHSHKQYVQEKHYRSLCPLKTKQKAIFNLMIIKKFYLFWEYFFNLLNFSAPGSCNNFLISSQFSHRVSLFSLVFHLELLYFEIVNVS